MIKFQRLGDEEGNVEFTQPLVETSDNSANQVLYQNGRNWLRSLNHFQKISLALLTFLAFLVFLLLLVTAIGSRNAHYRSTVHKATSTTPAMYPSATTRTASPIIRSQDVVTRVMRIKFEFEKNGSDIRYPYLITRWMPPDDSILSEISNLKESNGELKSTVGIGREISPQGMSVTSSSEKSTIIDSTNTAPSHHRTAVAVNTFKEHANNTVGSKDGVSREMSPYNSFVTTSSSQTTTTIVNNSTTPLPVKTSMNVTSLEHANDTVGSKDGVSREMSPHNSFVTTSPSEKPSTNGNNNTESLPDRIAMDITTVGANDGVNRRISADSSFETTSA